jgi:polyhydroxyalkanoate synthesis repressor PhaR
MSETDQADNADSSAKDPKVIKRYTNRKLYDTVESRYVTLDEIAEMVKQGVEVRIVDNRSKEDLTSVTLAQIIFEEEKKKNRMPLSVLREIIRHPGESISDFISREVSPRVASIREEAESRLDKLLRREEELAAQGAEAAEASADPATPAPDLARTSQRVFEEWQRRLDERVRQALENVTGNLPAFGRDLQQVADKIEALERRLDALEKKRGQ